MQRSTLSPRQRADHACSFCRQRKRACDRILPQCSTCISKQVVCEYSIDRQWSVSLAPIDIAGEPKGPIFLTDGPASEKRPHLLSSGLFTPLPPALLGRVSRFGASEWVLASLGDGKTVANEYFDRIHWWWPMIAKSQVSPRLADIENYDGELTLLLLAMKVIAWRPSKQGSLDPDPITSAYVTAKHALSEAAMTSNLSLRLLQAQILVAIYETGHAIYPAAFISVAACAQYGYAMHANQVLDPKNLTPNASFNRLEREEQRRTWWAILILDRHLHLGNPSHRLCTEDPSSESLLPTNDDLLGPEITGSSFPVSAPASLDMGSFARMAQAAHLLGKVLHFTESSLEFGGWQTRQARQNEYWQLDKTVRSLLNLSYLEGEMKRMAICGQTAICYSALVALHDSQHSRTDPEYLQFTVELLKPVVDLMMLDSDVFLSGRLVSIEDASPILIRWAYDAGLILSRLASLYEFSDLEHLRRMVGKLEIMSQRWLAAEVCLKLLADKSGVSESLTSHAI
ncbi:hypothetical protein B0I35DRAFT_397306 [Stachybotrys elegans]|uniref:Zn(2)-C6 fungal-type domain-containing protein n=1 Tax=Stachybotrys elegans TaxID=80388 RepID=A0A8K0SP16_9HYPO|nr:hypothetical protein B0I35DRAFT_397306 [Stachybotrys elegans]